MRPDELGVDLTPDALESIERYLDQWDEAAAEGPEFDWETDFEPEQLVALGGAWLEIAQALADDAERRGYPMSPPEGDEFYRALVTGFLDALERESGEYGELATRLRLDWPGLKTEEP